MDPSTKVNMSLIMLISENVKYFVCWSFHFYSIMALYLRYLDVITDYTTIHTHFNRYYDPPFHCDSIHRKCCTIYSCFHWYVWSGTGTVYSSAVMETPAAGTIRWCLPINNTDGQWSSRDISAIAEQLSFNDWQWAWWSHGSPAVCCSQVLALYPFCGCTASHLNGS